MTRPSDSDRRGTRMSALPKVTVGMMIAAAERDVVEKAMAAVRKTIALGADDGSNQPRLDRLISESLSADLALQDACSLLADLRGTRLDGAN